LNKLRVVEQRAVNQEKLSGLQNTALLSWRHGPDREGAKKCWYCHKVGHLKKDCRKLQRAEEKCNLADGDGKDVPAEPEAFYGIAF